MEVKICFEWFLSTYDWGFPLSLSPESESLNSSYSIFFLFYYSILSWFYLFSFTSKVFDILSLAFWKRSKSYKNLSHESSYFYYSSLSIWFSVLCFIYSVTFNLFLWSSMLWVLSISILGITSYFFSSD